MLSPVTAAVVVTVAPTVVADSWIACVVVVVKDASVAARLSQPAAPRRSHAAKSPSLAVSQHPVAVVVKR